MELIIENFKIMENISKLVEQESFKAYPVVTNVKGSDCNKRNREDWVDACNKGVQIMKEMMETLKDFDTWKEWKNTNPVVEWDDSHELSNLMNEIVVELEEWKELVEHSVEYDDILYKTQTLEPVDSGNSLHCHHADYEVDGVLYRLTWEIGNSNKPIIEYKIVL